MYMLLTSSDRVVYLYFLKCLTIASTFACKCMRPGIDLCCPDTTTFASNDLDHSGNGPLTWVCDVIGQRLAQVHSDVPG